METEYAAIEGSRESDLENLESVGFGRSAVGMMTRDKGLVCAWHQMT